MNSLSYSLDIVKIPVVLKGTDGKEQTYELREMSSAQRDRYLDSLGDRVRYSPDGKPVGIKKMFGMQADLLCLCLYKGHDPGKEELVKRDEVQAWPSSMVTKLFTKAQEINELNLKPEGDDEPKKD